MSFLGKGKVSIFHSDFLPIRHRTNNLIVDCKLRGTPKIQTEFGEMKCSVDLLTCISRAISTLGPAYNEFGYNDFGCNEHLTTTSRFHSIKIIDCNVKQLSCNKQPLVVISFFYIFLLVVSGTQGSWNWHVMKLFSCFQHVYTFKTSLTLNIMTPNVCL